MGVNVSPQEFNVIARTEDAFVSLPDYWDGIAKALDARLAAAKKHLRHPTSASSAEAHLKDLLREYLPKRYAVDTGFVMNASGRRSHHLDIIVADTFHIPPLCSEPTYKVFAAESVCAVVEVTTSPRSREKGKSKFYQDLAKLGDARALCERREYFEIQPVLVRNEIKMQPISFTLTGSPRSYIVTSGDEWRSADTYQRNLVSQLKTLNKEGKPTWLNAALSIQHGLLVFTAYTNHEARWHKQSPLLNFILRLNQGIATFSTAKIDIKRYAKVLPDDSQ